MKVSTNKKMLFIGKGGKGYGMGHLVRLCALYDFLRYRYQISFLINDDSRARRFMKRKKVKVYTYREFSGIFKFRKHGDKNLVVVVDMLSIPESALKKIRKNCGLLVVFDDMHKSTGNNIHAAVICPQEIFESRISFNQGNLVIKGADYFPLRKDFITYRKRKTFRNPVKNVFISLGGAPSSSHTLAMARILDGFLDEKLKIHVVLGYVPPKSGKSFSKRVIFHQQVDSMASLIARMDLGIIAGGFIKFEFMCLGTPFCMVSLNAHQKELAEKFSSAGYGIYLGQVNTVVSRPESVRRKVNMLISDSSLRRKMFLKSRGLVDGKGSTRFLELIDKLTKKETR